MERKVEFCPFDGQRLLRALGWVIPWSKEKDGPDNQATRLLIHEDGKYACVEIVPLPIRESEPLNAPAS